MSMQLTPGAAAMIVHHLRQRERQAADDLLAAEVRLGLARAALREADARYGAAITFPAAGGDHAAGCLPSRRPRAPHARVSDHSRPVETPRSGHHHRHGDAP